MLKSLRSHWPEYLYEAAGLGFFMISAGLFASLLEYPESPLYRSIPSPGLRRMLMGLAMGSTAVAIIYSPWGKQSGAHINPALTLTFLRLGKIHPWDAFYYVVAQFAGGIAGILLVTLLLGGPLAHPRVNYVATIPGPWGVGAAFAAEVFISFGLICLVLFSTNNRSWHRYTGLLAGALVAAYITLEAPISGMSMNPARSLASSVPGQLWSWLWIYFSAPLLGMLLGAELFSRVARREAACAKYHHANDKRCIFRCQYSQMESAPERDPGPAGQGPGWNRKLASQAR